MGSRSVETEPPRPSTPDDPADLAHALVTLYRFILIMRIGAVLTLTAGAAVVTPAPLSLALAAETAVAVSAVEVLALRLRAGPPPPSVLVTAETLGTGTLLVIGPADPLFFCFGAGSAALTGAAFGRRALPLWLGQTVLGYWLIAADLAGYSGYQASPALAAYQTGLPALYVVAGLAAAAARATVTDHVRLARSALTVIERSAVSSERRRLARELHDSFAQTLKGLSFAAYALPSSMKNRPDTAQALALLVAEAARTASGQARDVLEALRTDDVGVPFDLVVERTCTQWSARTHLALRLRLEPVEAGVETRHELLRILREALMNAQLHAAARQVVVTLRPVGREGSEPDRVRIVIRDDGVGFVLPHDLAELSAGQHYGLIGMHERAARVGGTLVVESAPGLGTTVCAEVAVTPIEKAREDR